MLIAEQKVCKCKIGYFNGTGCTTNCGIGKYGNTTTYKCEACDSQCITCYGYGITKCISCNGANGYYLQNTTCVLDCDPGYYKNSTLFQCLKCQGLCSTCLGSATTCTGCISGYTFNNNVCEKCIDFCSNCDTDPLLCDTCQEPFEASDGDTKCVCSQGLTFDPINQICVGKCPDNYFTNTSRICQLCSSHYPLCQTCDSQNCLTCKTGYTLYNFNCVCDYFYLVRSTGSCVQTCPSRFYANSTTRLCEACDPRCSTCKGPSQNDCTSCNSSYFYNGICYDICPNGTYNDTSVCVNCNSPIYQRCNECSIDLNKVVTCTSCQDTYYLDFNATEGKDTCENRCI